jgi:hypothetical protein
MPLRIMAEDDDGPAHTASKRIDAVIEEASRQEDAAKVAQEIARRLELHTWRSTNDDSCGHLGVALRAAQFGGRHAADVARAVPRATAPAATR